jgi:hypothetical protein
MDERHGYNMSPSTHLWGHGTYGTRLYYFTGLKDFVIGDGSLITHAQFGYNQFIAADEDITFNVAAANYGFTMPILFLSGAVASPYMYVEMKTTACLKYQVADTRISYNLLSGGNWTVAQATDGNFVLAHIIFINDRTHPVASILGFAEYSTANLAKAGAQSEAAMILDYYSSAWIPEKAIIASVIFQTSSSYTNTVKARIVEVSAGVNYEDMHNVDLRTLRTLKTLGLI